MKKVHHILSPHGVGDANSPARREKISGALGVKQERSEGSQLVAEAGRLLIWHHYGSSPAEKGLFVLKG